MIDMLSKKGSRHSAQNEENQDAICFEENRTFIVMTLADGASACYKAKEGAAVTSRSLVRLLAQKGDWFFDSDNNQIARTLLFHVLYELKEQSITEGISIEEYSSTMAGVVYDKKRKALLYFSLGDSLILGTDGERCKVLAMPANSMNGCCVTTTKNAAEMMDVGIVENCDLNSVLICSDGAWREMYDKNRLKPEVAGFICRNEYDSLKEFLSAQSCADDYSFISLGFCADRNGKCA